MIRRSNRSHKALKEEGEPSQTHHESNLTPEEKMCIEIPQETPKSPTKQPLHDITPKEKEAKPELDSVVSNLQEQLNKVSSNSRPQRQRKAPEKLEHELFAKQIKAKAASKKSEDQAQALAKPSIDIVVNDQIENKIEEEKKITIGDKDSLKKSCSNLEQSQIQPEQHQKLNLPELGIQSNCEDIKIQVEQEQDQTLKKENDENVIIPNENDTFKVLQEKPLNRSNSISYNEPESNENDRSKAKKMPWSEEEDKLVIRLVEEHGPQKWTFIASHIPGRIGKQCRERWHNHLNPKISKQQWSDDEEWLLFLCHRLKGNRWAEITSYLPGRTDNAIKNHWNSSMKKRIPELFSRFASLKKLKGEFNIQSIQKESEKEILAALLQQPFGTDEENQIAMIESQKRSSQNKIHLKKTDSNISNNTPSKQDKKFIKKLSNRYLQNNPKESIQDIIERIPQEKEAFQSFRKQLILCQDEFYSHQTPSAKIQEETHTNSSDKTAFETPMAIGQLIKSNPSFIDIVKTALKYSSDAKNVSGMKNSGDKQNQLSAGSPLLSAIQSRIEEEKEKEDNQGESSNEVPSKKYQNDLKNDKKRRGRKSKLGGPNLINLSSKQVSIQSYSHYFILFQLLQQEMKKMNHPSFVHSMFMMNNSHHPMYHPHHPPPRFLGQTPPHLIAAHQGFPNGFPHGIPPPPHHFMRNGMLPFPHRLPIRGNGPADLRISNNRMHLHLEAISSNNHMNHLGKIFSQEPISRGNSCSKDGREQAEENSSFQTPQKFLKNNEGSRSSAFKRAAPNSNEIHLGESSENMNNAANKIIGLQDSDIINHKQIMINNVNIKPSLNLSTQQKQEVKHFEVEDYFNQSSFSKENIHPNILNIPLSSHKQQTELTQTHNQNYGTPSKYETPSKLLDFGSEPRVNCNSADNYFRYNSNQKIRHNNNALFQINQNNFSHSSNSAFKCYPQMDFHEGTSSAKKSAFS